MVAPRVLAPEAATHEHVPYHVGIATCHLEGAMEALTRACGVEWTPVREFGWPIDAPEGLLRVADSRVGPLRFEALQGPPGSIWDTDELVLLHHVACWSNHFDADVAAYEAAGWFVEMRVRDNVYLTKAGEARIELSASSERAGYMARLLAG